MEVSYKGRYLLSFGARHFHSSIYCRGPSSTFEAGILTKHGYPDYTRGVSDTPQFSPHGLALPSSCTAEPTIILHLRAPVWEFHFCYTMLMILFTSDNFL